MARPNAFQSRFRFPLQPLNVRGAYTTAALPSELGDPALASLWRRLGWKVRIPPIVSTQIAAS